MKSILKYFYIILFLGLGTFSSCSDDDPTPDDPKQEQPDKPGHDDNDSSKFDSKILGEWTSNKINHGTLQNVESSSQVIFTEDSITLKWFDIKTDKEIPYSIAKGKYTVKGDSLKIEWKNVMTDSVANTAFNTLYLQGDYKVKDNQLDYNYSVYDIGGEKLSGPHNIKLNKIK